MPETLPDLYFRIRDNGASVFRIDAESRHQRLEMSQIAVVNLRSGKVNPQGSAVLSAPEEAAIGEWIAARQALLARRERDDILRTVDHLNLAAHWAQSRASDEDLEAVTDMLLIAMHDLRSVLVRKKSDRLG